MRPEYTKFSEEEMVYGTEQLLKTRLEILKILKYEKVFKEIRSEEFSLKIALKAKVEEAKHALESLERLLPKPTFEDPKNLISKQEEILLVKKTHHLSLDEEIEAIRNKLAKLKNQK